MSEKIGKSGPSSLEIINLILMAIIIVIAFFSSIFVLRLDEKITNIDKDFAVGITIIQSNSDLLYECLDNKINSNKVGIKKGAVKRMNVPKNDISGPNVLPNNSEEKNTFWFPWKWFKK